MSVTAAVLVLLGAACAFALPQVRQFASGWWHDPSALVALPEAPQVRYESGGRERARAVAALLPAAIARVESIQGRPFGRPVTIGVYVSRKAFIAADGSGSFHPVGVTFLGRVILSPTLFATQRQRLQGILTHELSHAHLQSWISQIAFQRLPHWFTEGLAVLVSSGGGAEDVSEEVARDAIRRGRIIDVGNSGSLLKVFSGIEYVRAPETPNRSFQIEMAYRQAGMFLAYLHDSNPAAFAAMMNAILDSRSFAEAVARSYHADPTALWSQFSRSIERLQ